MRSSSPQNKKATNSLRYHKIGTVNNMSFTDTLFRDVHDKDLTEYFLSPNKDYLKIKKTCITKGHTEYSEELYHKIDKVRNKLYIDSVNREKSRWINYQKSHGNVYSISRYQDDKKCCDIYILMCTRDEEYDYYILP